MKKIPTLFKRDPDNRSRVLNEVTPGCEWVLDGEGIATRKYDGTCVMFDGERWWARREVKGDKWSPPDFVAMDCDPVTGKRVGWEPAEQSSFWKYLDEVRSIGGDPETTGTYELIGPKVNGNHEGWTVHALIRHGAWKLGDVPLDYDGLQDWLAVTRYEGIVWHHPDGRMAKLKKRDFKC